MYSYANDDSYAQCRKEAMSVDPADTARLSDETIADWFLLVR
jgi:hypothetical protein